MRKLFVPVIAAAALTVSVATTASEGIYLGPSATYYYLDSDRFVNGDDEASVLGLNLGYRFFNDWALEAGYGEDVSSGDLQATRLNFLYYFGEEKGQKQWRPFVVAGLSYFERDDDLNLQEDEDNTHQASIGFGFANNYSDHLEFRADARLLHKVREGQGGTNDGAINLQLNYYFNAPKPAPVAEEPAPRQVAYAPEPEPEPEVRTISIRLNVEFEFNKAVVRAIYGDELSAIANAMKAHEDIELVLEGHTDSKGSDEYNQDLSERRAAAVKAKLVEDYGLDSSRVSAVGYGESRPIADNSTEDGRARNRRVVGEMSFSEVMAD